MYIPSTCIVFTFNLKVEVTQFFQDTYKTAHYHMMHKPQNKKSINRERLELT